MPFPFWVVFFIDILRRLCQYVNKLAKVFPLKGGRIYPHSNQIFFLVQKLDGLSISNTFHLAEYALYTAQFTPLELW